MLAHFAAQNAYRDIALASKAAGASPHELVAMLFEGVIAALGRAGHAGKTDHRAVRTASLTRAIDIVYALQTGLDFERGNDVAKNLAALYDYIQQKLSRALCQNDNAAIAEAEKLLRDIANAWLAIAPMSRRSLPC
jgi:flagellar secretion chaperone FliS